MLVIERDFAGGQILGDRSHQEDTQGFVSLKDGVEGSVESLLTVLADGMGGENAGDVASENVVEHFVSFCHNLEHREDERNIPEILSAATLTANEGVAVAVEQDPSLEGMGCTLLATAVVDNILYWISVGDSPLYLYREGKLTQINEDHSMLPILERLVQEGKMSLQEFAVHPYRNTLRSAITGDELDLVDCPSAGLPLCPGDIIIVASDGIQTLSDKAIQNILEGCSACKADEIIERLLAAVQEAKKPRQDNASINVLRIPAG